MTGVIVCCASRIAAQAIYFILPATAELWTAITAFEIAGMIKVDFYISGYNVVFKTSAVFDGIIIGGGPWLAALRDG
jgi:hypothetical protein